MGGDKIIINLTDKTKNRIKRGEKKIFLSTHLSSHNNNRSLPFIKMNPFMSGKSCSITPDVLPIIFDVCVEFERLLFRKRCSDIYTSFSWSSLPCGSIKFILSILFTVDFSFPSSIPDFPEKF